jgi:hypothetical protein
LNAATGSLARTIRVLLLAIALTAAMVVLLWYAASGSRAEHSAERARTQASNEQAQADLARRKLTAAKVSWWVAGHQLVIQNASPDWVRSIVVQLWLLADGRAAAFAYTRSGSALEVLAPCQQVGIDIGDLAGTYHVWAVVFEIEPLRWVVDSDGQLLTLDQALPKFRLGAGFEVLRDRDGSRTDAPGCDRHAL